MTERPQSNMSVYIALALMVIGCGAILIGFAASILGGS